MKSAIVLCFANALATTEVEAMVNENEVIEVGALDLAQTAVDVLVSCVEGDFEDTCVGEVEWEGVLQEYPWCDPTVPDDGSTPNFANGRVPCLAMAEGEAGCQPRCVHYLGGTATFIAGYTAGDSFQVSQRVHANLAEHATAPTTPAECDQLTVPRGHSGPDATPCSDFAEVANPLEAFVGEYNDRHDASYNNLRCHGTDFTTFKNENTPIYECTKANPCPVSLRHNEHLANLDDPFSLIGCGKCISVFSERAGTPVVYHGVVVTYHTFEGSFDVPNAPIRDLVFLHDEATGPWSVDGDSYPPVSNLPYYFNVYDCGRKSAGCSDNSEEPNVDFTICDGVTAEGSACTESAPCGISVEEGLHACGKDLVRDGKYYRVTQTHKGTGAYWTPEFFVDAAVWSEALGQTSECSSILSGPAPATTQDVYFVDFTDIAEHDTGSASGVAIGIAALVALAM